ILVGVQSGVSTSAHSLRLNSHSSPQDSCLMRTPPRFVVVVSEWYVTPQPTCSLRPSISTATKHSDFGLPLPGTIKAAAGVEITVASATIASNRGHRRRLPQGA